MGKKSKKKPGPSNPNATVEYLVLKKNQIFRWLASGKTMTEVAEKLHVSRSWLFSMFNAYEDLDRLRKDAYESRRAQVQATLFMLAVGNYTTQSKSTVKTTKSDGEGNTTVNTTVEERTDEHVNDPNLRALGIYMRSENLKNQGNDQARIMDTIEPADYEYVDVADLPQEDQVEESDPNA